MCLFLLQTNVSQYRFFNFKNKGQHVRTKSGHFAKVSTVMSASPKLRKKISIGIPPPNCTK